MATKIKKRRVVITLTEDKDGQLQAQVRHEPSLKELDLKDVTKVPPCVIAGFRLSKLINKMGKALGQVQLPPQAPRSSLVDVLGRPLES